MYDVYWYEQISIRHGDVGKIRYYPRAFVVEAETDTGIIRYHTKPGNKNYLMPFYYQAKR